MLKLRINPIAARDLKNIRDYIAEDSEEYVAKIIKEIYGKCDNKLITPQYSPRTYDSGAHIKPVCGFAALSKVF